MQADQCPDELMKQLLARANAGPEAALAEIDRVNSQFPNDARLPFLGGSLLAGMQRYEEGLAAMARAVEIAPGFDVARFQYGFLLLTCGRPDAALEVWRALQSLPDRNPFRLFVQGLSHLVRDEFAETIANLEAGIAANNEHPLLNNDMQLIIDEVRARLSAPTDGEAAEPDAQSEAALLFGRYAVHDPSAYKH